MNAAEDQRNQITTITFEVTYLVVLKNQQQNKQRLN